MNNFYKGGRELAYLKGLSHYAVQQKTTAIRQHLQMQVQAAILANAIRFIDPITLLRKLWKSKAILLLWIALLHMFSLSAQTLSISIDVKKDSSIHPINIGDHIPEKLWNTILPVMHHPQLKRDIYLNEFKSKKLVIIDFWATWCAPCIASLKKLQIIEKKYPHQFSVLPVTYEKFDFLQKQMAKLNFYPFSVHSDPSLLQYFPHRSIPHQVWIVDGRVAHIGDANSATVENILAAIEGHIPQMKVKKEFLDYELTKPLEEYAMKANAKIYKKSVITGSISGIGGSYGIMKDAGNRLLYYNNATIINMISYATDIPLNRIWIDTLGSANKVIVKQVSCYQLITSGATSDDNMKTFFKDDLSATFNFRLDQILKKKVVSKVVRSIHVDKQQLDKLSYSIDIMSLIGLLNLSFNWKQDLPVYVSNLPSDTIIYSDKVIGPIIKNQKLLAELLRLNGMSIQQDVQDLEMLVADSN